MTRERDIESDNTDNSKGSFYEDLLSKQYRIHVPERSISSLRFFELEDDQETKVSRRKFIQTSGLLTAAGIISTNSLLARSSKLKNYGIQLWSVKNALAKDPKDVSKSGARPCWCTRRRCKPSLSDRRPWSRPRACCPSARARPIA